MGSLPAQPCLFSMRKLSQIYRSNLVKIAQFGKIDEGGSVTLLQG